MGERELEILQQAMGVLAKVKQKHSMEKFAHEKRQTLESIVGNEVMLKLRHNNKKQCKKRVPLSQTMRTTKKGSGSTVHQNKKAYVRDTMSYLSTPFLPKTAPPQQVQQKSPMRVIISFF